MRSTARRACWASTSEVFSWRGASKAARIAGSVISSKVTRLVVSTSRFSTSATCHAIASPSRSRSGASQTVSASLAALRSAATCFLEDSGIS
jgi:hypothetical protein